MHSFHDTCYVLVFLDISGCMPVVVCLFVNKICAAGLEK
jgi:hypothetical protein